MRKKYTLQLTEEESEYLHKLISFRHGTGA
jgi:hypothetical protein